MRQKPNVLMEYQMKSLLFALVFSLFSLSAFAEVNTDFRPGRPDHGWRQCTVRFQKCDFGFGGNCVKWNKKSFQVSRREARYGCEIARERYDQVRRCRVDCGYRD